MRPYINTTFAFIISFLFVFMMNASAQEFWNTINALYDKKGKLVFRDSRYFDKKEANGEKVFLGRGNGWVVGTFARVMNYLPDDYPALPQYLSFEGLTKIN